MVASFLRKSVRGFLRKRGLDINGFGTDFSDLDHQVIAKCEPFTLTSHSRIFNVIEAVRHVQRNNLEGAFVECGVWRGGCMMAAALSVLGLGMQPRPLYLYDTFEGMSEPTEKDVLNSDPKVTAATLLAASPKGTSGNIWCDASLEDVQNNMGKTGYPSSLIHYVQGKVEDTIPQTVPEKIAILRLDTDWYESTKHELEHLYPRIVKGGLLIIDDYGFWKGSREAVDKYFEAQSHFPFLARIDTTGRVCVKM